jgi:hypothetical protein
MWQEAAVILSNLFGDNREKYENFSLDVVLLVEVCKILPNVKSKCVTSLIPLTPPQFLQKRGGQAGRPTLRLRLLRLLLVIALEQPFSTGVLREIVQYCDMTPVSGIAEPE